MKNKFNSHQEESKFGMYHLITLASLAAFKQWPRSLVKGWVLATVGSYTHAQ